jgi:plasmid stabilization system protein ParE
MEVRWSPQAALDLERIFTRIHKENPTAAHEVIVKL